MLKHLKTISMVLFLGILPSGISHAVATPKVDGVHSSQQAGTCKGIVKDVTGETVIGASLRVKGTTNGTITGLDGDFTLGDVKNGDVIVISFVGYITQEVVWKGIPINVILKEDSQTLDEVVVVAFGVQKKVNVTGAVSSVDAKEITARPVNSAIDALQGVVPGMSFSTGKDGGSLTSNKSFSIRGTGTIGAGSKVEPLVLIDGMEGDINTINPQDIENISVLKDAAASSIYGSRAPGGVVLVTTKRGKAGKTVINYNNNFRFLSPMRMPQMANSYETALYFNDAQVDGDMFPAIKVQQLKDVVDGKAQSTMFANPENKWEVWDRTDLMPTGNTDWLKYHFGDSFTHEHSLSANGGSEKIQYYFSANYLDQGGLLKHGNDNKQRYTITGKINAELSKWFKAGYTVRFGRVDYDAPSYLDDAFYHNVSRYWPTIPIKDPNGFYTIDSKYYQLTEGGRRQDQNDELSQQLSFMITPLEGWTINAELNYRTNNTFRHKDFQTVYAHDVNSQPFPGDNTTSSVSEYAYKSNFFNPNIFTQYSKEFAEGHNAKIMLGFQSEWFKQREINASRSNIIAGIPTLNTADSNQQNNGGFSEWATAGFFGRVNYDYQGRYLAEVNLRYDGTSRFLSQNRWNLFPSFSLGWNVAREAFFEDFTEVVNTLKIRGSWGELGNQNTDSWYPFYRTVRFNKNGDGNRVLGDWLVNGVKPNISAESALVSEYLTWEKTQTLDIGLDLGLLNNRLNITFDYFQRKSKDMVGPAPELPAILGIGVPKVNNLDMTSKGWEILVNWRDQIRDFKYGVTFSLSDNKVVIDKYPNPSMTFLDKDNKQTYYTGTVLGEIWGFETAGIAKDQQEMDAHLASLPKGGQDAVGDKWGAGDIMFKDLNNDGKISRGDRTLGDTGDMKVIGNNTPRYNFGLNLDGAYKGFDLKIFFQGVFKRDYMPGGMMFWGADGGKWQSMAYKPHLDYFRDDANHPLGLNLNSYYPRLDWDNGKNRQPQTQYLQNAAYCRLKNVTLGYTLPLSLTQKFFVSNLRVFVSAENLFTITGLSDMFDPELLGIGWSDGKSYPLSKTFSFGLNVTF